MLTFHDSNNTVLIYAQNAFSNVMRKNFPLRAKTADGYIRYAKTHIVGVIDSSAVEVNVSQVLGIREDILLFKSIESFLEMTQQKPNILMIGIAPSGGEIDKQIYDDICFAIEHGMHIMSGMHFELEKDSHIQALAKQYNRTIWDVRMPPEKLPVASAQAYFIKKPIILTCAADAAIGKMTVGLEIEKELLQRGKQGELLATGQTAIMIKGKGISIDRVIGDFMPGAMEKLLIDAEKERPENDFYIIEGQGGLLHPGYAPVTLALLHGGLPTHLILVVRPSRKHSIGSKLIKLPTIQETMDRYIASSLPIRIPQFLGIAVHTAGMEEEAAVAYINEVKEKTHLPVEDVIRFPTHLLADAVERLLINFAV